MAATKAEVVDGAQEDPRGGREGDPGAMGRRAAALAASRSASAISRPTVRKYVQAGLRIGLVRGSRRIDEVGWERAARAAIAQVAAGPRRRRRERWPSPRTTSISPNVSVRCG